MKEKILFVDDDANLLAGIRRNLHRYFALETAANGEEALSKMRSQGPFAVMVSDMHMPAMNGLELLSKAALTAPDTVRIVLTGQPDLRTAVAAVNGGHIFQFLTKPCSIEILADVLEVGVRQYRLVRAEKDLLERTLNGAIRLMVDILAAVDPILFGHSRTVRDEMRQFVQRKKLGDDWIFEVAALLHPIGHVTTPPSLLQKSRSSQPLSDHEKGLLARASEVGSELLVNVPRLEAISQIVRYQNKHFDGTGSPDDSVAGADIPVASRILKVLIDRLELRESGMTPQKVAETLKARSGVYDPDILAAILEESTGESSAAPDFGAPHEIALKDLLPGMVLDQDVLTKNDMLIVKGKTKITPILLQRLNNFAQLSGIKDPIWVR